MTARVGFVAIGRNEGERLVACLDSLKATGAGPIVYVDSGSSDGSPARATSLGAQVVALDMSVPFTAARARNDGAARLQAIAAPDFIQFIDGDCALAQGWVEEATAFLGANPKAAIACGRRRERHPGASVYNRLCDIEWATPVGETAACGGDAMVRGEAFRAVGGYRDDLIAGEEPELCLRLRERGWRIYRLDAEMTTHDAAMMRFSQWWRRAVRAGHAYAEVSTLHRRSEKRIWVAETRRAFLWTGAGLATLSLGVAISPYFLLILLIYPAQAARLWLRARPALGRDAFAWGLFTTLGKLPEALGAARHFAARLRGQKSRLIEYK